MPSPFSIPYRSRRFQTAAVAITLATAGAVTGLGLYLSSGSSTQAHITANNISRNFRACLITDNPNTPAAQNIWTGVRNAAGTATVNAQRIITPSNAQTTTALLPYIESLIQRKCGLIVSTGTRLDAATTAAAKSNPHQHFLIDGTTSSLPNITTLPTPTSAAVTDAVHAASQNRSTQNPTPTPTS